jgi:hypothetical protein
MAGSKRAKSSTSARAAKKQKKPAAPRTKKKSAAPRPKKTGAAPRAIRTRGDNPLVAAAPLLASAPKKVGKVARKKVGKVTRKRSDAVQPNAPYQPKTDVTPDARPHSKTPRVAAIQPFDPLALAQPWLRLGFQMAMSNIALQARIARAAMDLPPTAAAIRQGSDAYRSWLSMLGSPRPAKG